MAKKKKEATLQIENVKEKEDSNILLPNKVDIDLFRDELKSYVDEKVNQTFFDELEKTNKKLIREKSRRLFWKNIIIVLLLLIIGFLVYLLYSNNYFDKYFNKETPQEEKETSSEISPTTSPSPTPTPTVTPTPTPTLDDLKKEYASLLDDYYVTANSIYLVDFYDGKLSNDMRKYITLNKFDFTTFEKEEDYNIIKESTFKLMYEKLFGDDYSSGTFLYDSNKIRYVKAMESYMTTSLLVREENTIKREIKDIKVDGKEITITTIEGLVKDNILYNIISNEEIDDYDDNSLIKYEDKLNKLVYTFKNNQLISLSK